MASTADYTGPETALREAARLGLPADFTHAVSDEARAVRGSVVSEVCSDSSPTAGSTPISIVGAVIKGDLSLAAKQVQRAIEFVGCTFDSAINLEGAKVQGIKFSHCQLVEFQAAHAVFSGSLRFEAECVVTGPLSIVDAVIGNDLTFERSKIAAQPTVLDATRVRVEGSVNFGKDAHLTGQVILLDAVIKGALVLEGSRFENPHQMALNASRVFIGSTLQIGKRFRSEGELRFQQAEVRGSVELDDAFFKNENGVALYLNAAQIKGPILVRGGVQCAGEFALRYASLGATLEVEGASFENPNGVALSLNRTAVAGGLMFRRGFRALGELSFSEARITTGLAFEDVQLENGRGVAVRADGLSVGGSLTFRHGGRVNGTLRMVAARIGSALEIENITISNVGGACIEAYGLTTDGPISFRPGFRCMGEIRLNSAKLGGDLELIGVDFANRGGVALRGDGLTTKGAIRCATGAAVHGTIRLNHATIGTTMDISETILDAPGAACIEANNAKIGNVLLNKGLQAMGRVSFMNARISGMLECSEVYLKSSGRVAFDAEGADVGQAALFVKSFITGELRLMDAHVETVLECRESTFENGGGACINASRLKAGGRVSVRLSASAKGDLTFVGAKFGGEVEFTGGPAETVGLVSLNLSGIQAASSARLGGLFCRSIRIARAKIEGDLDCTGVLFLGSDLNSFIGSGMVVKGAFVWRRITRPQGHVDLTGAKVGQLNDDEISWPKPGFLWISNFTYESLSEDSPADRRRLDWLRRQARFTRQPYEQASKALRQIGRTSEARAVGVAQRRDERAADVLAPGARAWNVFLDLTIGHGHQIWKALIWAAAFVLIGAATFRLADRQLHIISPVDHNKASLYHFSPLVYSLDVFLPAVDLYQEKNFTIVPAARWQGVFLFWCWIEILAGWLLTTVVLAGLTGLVKKE